MLLYALLAVIVIATLFTLLTYRKIHRSAESLKESSRVTKKPLSTPTDRIEVITVDSGQRRYSCGHGGPKRFVIHFWGEELSPSDATDICPTCIVESSKDGVIRCYDCHLPIFKGDGVALWTRTGPRREHPDTAEVDGEGVSCLRWMCAETMAAFVGYWNGEGIDYYYASKNSVAAEAFATGEPQSASTHRVRAPQTITFEGLFYTLVTSGEKE